ncbi:hypothetical protein [Geodermatophilus sp. FMUSA9-8]|uniref:hypothetical protein n=1 Tax=Geodermatophilus sp. FMUSA9-8 TaxID=3120155 RepID=UPI00300B59D2
MNKTTDPLTRLKALRPTPALDEDWSAAELTRITASTTASATEQRFPRRHRRRIVSGALSGAMLAGGIGTAAAMDLPERLLDLLGSMSADPDSAAATVQRAGTAPGPDGQVFTVVTWEEEPGHEYAWCTSAVFETAASAAGPVPADFDQSGGLCGPSGFPNDFAVETGVLGTDPYVVYGVSAGTAVRGELRLPDGSIYPTVLARGWLHGWYPAGSDGVLTGYAADGSVVGTLDFSGRVPR